MTNQRSPLESLNMHRERRPLASLDELNRTLSALESHLRETNSTANFAHREPAETTNAQTDALEFLRNEQAQPPVQPAAHQNPHKEALAAIAEELQRLRARTELKQAAAASEHVNRADATPIYASAPDSAPEYRRVSAADRFIAGTSSYTTTPSGTTDTETIMRRDFEELKRTVETLAREESLRRMSHRWDALDERFDNFEQKQSEKLNAHKSIDPALHAISVRLEALSRNIEQLPGEQSHTLSQLDERLDEISRAIMASGYGGQQQEAVVLTELDRRFAELTRHLDEQYHNSAHKTAINDDRFIQALENRLDYIARQVAEQATPIPTPIPTPAHLADQQLLRNMEKQLGFITQHLSNPESLIPELAEIKPRLDTIERSIDMNRDLVLAAAREAAEEAIRQVVDKGTARDTGFARELADDLKVLEQLTRESDERNSRTFDRVHDTLLKIAERLGQIENDNIRKPPHIQPSQTKPSQEQDTSGRFANQFSIPGWDNNSEQISANPFSELRSNSTRSSAFSGEAVTEATKPAEHADHTNQPSMRKPPRKSLLSGLANAVRGTRASDTTLTADIPATPEAFQFDENEILSLDIEAGSAFAQGKVGTSAARTEQTLAAMPDLNAIISRVRDEQRGRSHLNQPTTSSVTPLVTLPDTSKADLISAARRTVQAAAAEAGRARDQNLNDSSLTGSSLNADFVADEDRIAGSDTPKRPLRKPLFLAIGAIIIAATGLQLGSSYLSKYRDSSVSEAPDLANIQPAAHNAEPLTPVVKKSSPASLPTITVPNNTAYNQPDSVSSSPSTLQITSVNHRLMDNDIEAQPLGLQNFPSQPLSANSMIGSTQAVIKPVVIAPLTKVVPSDQNPQTVATPVNLSQIPAVPKDAGPVALRNAAEAGDPHALYEIGLRYTEGRGVPNDYAQAAQWYALSAERGFAPAQYRLGNFNEKGLGTQQDTVKATELYQQAAAQGNASAMHNLAVLKAMGANSTPDNDNAAKWFFKAAELGVKDSQYNLGILTAKGLGVPKNLEESYKWFSLAANAGDSDAAEKRDQVAKSLKPEQLDRAINLTKLWKPKTMLDEANSVQIPDAWSDETAVTTASIDMKKAVRNIQLILQKNGYDTGVADGMMGEKTREAISAFQKANNMKPTGEVDQLLVEALLSKNS